MKNHSKQWGHQKTMKQIMPLQVRKIRKGEKIRYIAIALAVGVITLACIWFATKPENEERPGKQIEEMKNENVDMPDQGVNGFDFDWKD